MNLMRSHLLLVLLSSLASVAYAEEMVIYPGNGNDPEGAELLLVYPGVDSGSIVYRLGKPRNFRIRYAENIDPASFSAELNGKNISKRFHPAPGREENVFLRLKRGESQLYLQIAGDDPKTGKAYADLDLFTIVLKGPQTRAGLRDAPPPGFEHRALPPAPAENPGKPLLIDKSNH